MKKNGKDILFYSFLICLYLIFSIFLRSSYLKAESKLAVKTISCSVENSSFNIILDPGHGGEDGGAVPKDGMLEKDLNLAISKKLYDLLVSSGFKVILTRDSDISIYDEKCETIREKKVSDIKKRIQIANSDPTNIMISIHQNKFTKSESCGAQIFYSKNNPKSKILAESARNSIVSGIQPENERECKVADKGIYLLNKVVVPAIVIECGFLSNDDERKNLNDENYQMKLAKCIYEGFVNYIM